MKIGGRPAVVVVPVVSVMFFLLMFFVMNALCVGARRRVPLGLPSTSASATGSVRPVAVALAAARALCVSGRRVSSSHLTRRIGSVIARTPRRTFIVHTSGSMCCGSIVRLLSVLGIGNTGCVDITARQG